MVFEKIYYPPASSRDEKQCHSNPHLFQQYNQNTLFLSQLNLLPNIYLFVIAFMLTKEIKILVYVLTYLCYHIKQQQLDRLL